MANPHINYATFKSRFGDLGITEWTKYNYLSNYNFGLPAQTEVPSDYLELEYIQSGGAQYIDLDHIGNEKTYVEIDAVNKDITLGGNRLFGARTLSDQPDAMFISTNGGSDSPCFDYYQFGGSGYNVRPTSADRRMYNIGGDDVEPFETPEPLLLFNAYSQSAPSQGYWAVYNAKLYQDKVLIRDMHPVKRLSDGVIGMYDTVSGQFFQNRGQDSFTAGPMKQRYVRVEYVKSNGDDYVDTGVKGNLNTYVELDARITEISSTARFFGNRLSSNTEAFCFGEASNGNFFAHFDTVSATTVVSTPKDTNRHIFELSKQGFYIDKVLNSTYNNAVNFTTPYNLLIGACADEESIGNPSKVEVYACRIYNNSQLVRDFVPVYDLVTEKYGLFDLVSDTFYGSVNNLLTGPWKFQNLGMNWQASLSTPHGYWTKSEYTPTYSRADLSSFWLYNANGYKYIGGVLTGSANCQDHEFAVQQQDIPNEFYVKDLTADTVTDISNHLSGTTFVYK